MVRPLIALALLTLLTLPACDNPTAGPPAEAEPEITRADFDSDVAYANAKRQAAFREMLSLPPDEYRAFMKRNEWKRRWPEMWGPEPLRENAFRVQAAVKTAPYPFPDAEEMAVLQAFHERDPQATEEALGMMMGRSRASLRDFKEWMLSRWTEQVEEHARRWDSEASASAAPPPEVARGWRWPAWFGTGRGR